MDRFDEEARRVHREMHGDLRWDGKWGVKHTREANAIAAALRGAFMLGTRHRVDAAFSQLIANLVPYMDAQSMHAVHAECAKIEERLAPPAPKPDAGEASNPFARLYGACPDLPEPNPVSQPTAQSNGEGDALGKPVTYGAGTVPEPVMEPQDGEKWRNKATGVEAWIYKHDVHTGVVYYVTSVGHHLMTAPVYRFVNDYERPIARDFADPRGGDALDSGEREP
jgi:hypothetical protein